jgi:hypothetical protein
MDAKRYAAERRNSRQPWRRHINAISNWTMALAQRQQRINAAQAHQNIRKDIDQG